MVALFKKTTGGIQEVSNDSQNISKIIAGALIILAIIIVASLVFFITSGFYSKTIQTGDYAVSMGTLALTVATIVLALYSGSLARIEERRDRREQNQSDLNRIYTPLEVRFRSMVDLKDDMLRDNSWLSEENSFKSIWPLLRPKRHKALNADLVELETIRAEAKKLSDSIEKVILKVSNSDVRCIIDFDETKRALMLPKYRASILGLVNLPVFLGDEGKLKESMRSIESDASMDQEYRSIVQPLTEQIFRQAMKETKELRANYINIRKKFFDKATSILSNLRFAQETEGEAYLKDAGNMER